MSERGRHLFVPNLNLAYIRNPKAASTSLSLMMLENIYPELKIEQLSAEQVNFLADLNLHNHILREEKEAVFFIVVRSPFDRLIAVYREFFERPSDHFIYDDYIFGIFKKDFSFAEFIDTILMIPDVLKDQHLKPQTHFLRFYQRRNMSVKILKIENKPELDLFLSHYHLVLPEINKHPLPRNYRQYYDAVTLYKVSQLYATDIEVLGYSHEYEALKRSCAGS